VKRRTVLAALAAACVPTRLAVAEGARLPRLGLLFGGVAGGMTPQLEAFKDGLRQLGYLEGKNISLEFRSAEGRYESLRGLADELVALKVDLIVAFGTPPSQAAKAATRTIPIVMSAVGDPIGSGLVTSLARPGANVTGTSNLSPPLVVKRLELLKESDPELRRVGLFANPANPAQAATVRAVEDAARSLKVEIFQYPVRSTDAIRAAFSSMRTDRIEGLVLGNDTLLIGNSALIAQLAEKQRIRSSGNREFAEAGGLIGYGSVADVNRLSASYVDKILKGAKPGELPIEQPSKYETFLNLRAAKAADFAIPASFRLLRVDRVIE
jgi:putative ABC transport system substrate-binding protein